MKRRSFYISMLIALMMSVGLMSAAPVETEQFNVYTGGLYTNNGIYDYDWPIELGPEGYYVANGVTRRIDPYAYQMSETAIDPDTEEPFTNYFYAFCANLEKGYSPANSLYKREEFPTNISKDDILAALEYINDTWGLGPAAPGHELYDTMLDTLDEYAGKIVAQGVIWGIIHNADVYPQFGVFEDYGVYGDTINNILGDLDNLRNAYYAKVADGTAAIVDILWLVGSDREWNTIESLQELVVPVFVQTVTPRGSAQFDKMVKLVGDNELYPSHYSGEIFTFELQKFNGSSWEVVDTYETSLLFGTITASDLEPGSYRFVEIDIPEGWAIEERYADGIAFIIDDDGETHYALPTVINPDGENPMVINFETVTGEVEFTKLKLVGGEEVLAEEGEFEFELWKKGASGQYNELIGIYSTDEDGIVYADGLEPGDYRFKEITKGDWKLARGIEYLSFTINEDGSRTWTTDLFDGEVIENVRTATPTGLNWNNGAWNKGTLDTTSTSNGLGINAFTLAGAAFGSTSTKNAVLNSNFNAILNGTQSWNQNAMYTVIDRDTSQAGDWKAGKYIAPFTGSYTKIYYVRAAIRRNGVWELYEGMIIVDNEGGNNDRQMLDFVRIY